MEVIILAGGLGTRLRSEVKDVPKCMAPIADKPFLWYLLKYLSKYKEVTRVILSVGYLRDVIFDWISTVQNHFNFIIDYAVEEEPLGTGGAISLAMELVTEDEAIILNGDTFFDIDLNLLIAAHKSQSDAKLTIALKAMKDFDRYGTVDVLNDDIDHNIFTSNLMKILCFNEKQHRDEGFINGGVYCLTKDKSLFEGQSKKFSFETTIMQEKCGKEGCLWGIVQEGFFIDIGIPEDYHRAQNYLIETK